MKKIYLLLIALMISSMAIAAVSAGTDMETKDFDGKFTIDVPKGATFEDNSDGAGKIFFSQDIGITIVYFVDPKINSTSINDIYQEIANQSDYTIQGTEGNVTTLTSNGGDGCIMSVYKDGIYVTVSGTDKELIKSMIDTVKFK